MGRPKSVTDAEILEVIAEHGEISQRDLARFMNISESALSRRITDLKDKGKISIREVRDGSVVRNMLSCTEPTPPEVEDQVMPRMAEVETLFPDEHVESEVRVLSTKAKHSNQSFVFLASIIFLAWSTTFLVFPLAGAIATDFGPVTIQEVRNLLAIFLFLGGPLTLLWAWLEHRRNRKTGSSKHVIPRKTLLLVSLLVWAIGHFLLAIPTFGSLVALLLVMILAFAPLSATSVSLALDLFHSKHAKRVFLLLVTVAILGMGCGSAFAAVAIAFVPWQIPFILLGTLGLVLIGVVLGLEPPKINNEGESNRPPPQTSNINRFLVFNIALNIALGSLIYYLAQIFMPPYELLVLSVLVILLPLYTSHILYYIYCQSKK